MVKATLKSDVARLARLADATTGSEAILNIITNVGSAVRDIDMRFITPDEVYESVSMVYGDDIIKTNMLPEKEILHLRSLTDDV